MDCRSSAALSESLDSTALPCAFSPAEDRHFERLLDGFNLDDVSISLDYGEMHASSALCEVGDVAACMAAAAAKKSPAAAAAQQHPSPSIINSPTWVRASLGAVTLAETTSNALWASPSTSMNSLGLNPHPQRPFTAGVGHAVDYPIAIKEETKLQHAGRQRRMWQTKEKHNLPSTPQLRFQVNPLQDIHPCSSVEEQRWSREVFKEQLPRPTRSSGEALQSVGGLLADLEPGRADALPGRADTPVIEHTSDDVPDILESRLKSFELQRLEALADGGKKDEVERLEVAKKHAEDALVAAEERLDEMRKRTETELEGSKSREVRLELKLKEAEKEARVTEAMLADALTRIKELEANEQKFARAISARRDESGKLAAMLSASEAECQNLKEIVFEADSEKEGLRLSVQAAKAERDDARFEVQRLNRSVEMQESLITDLEVALKSSKDEIVMLRRRCYWLECRAQGSSAEIHRDSDLRSSFGDAPSSRPLLPLSQETEHDNERANAPLQGTDGKRLRSSTSSIPQRSHRMTQSDLEVLKHLMDKVKAARKGNEPVNHDSPQGLTPEERDVFKYLMQKMKSSDTSVQHHEDSTVADHSAHVEARNPTNGSPPVSRRRRSSQSPSGDGQQRRFANRPAPWATGFGDGSSRASAGEQGRQVEHQRDPYVSSIPFGTQETLEQSARTTNDLDSKLQELNKEKDMLEAEYSRMPMNGGKTNEARKRMQWVESRLDVLKKDISRCRLHLKKLGA